MDTNISTEEKILTDMGLSRAEAKVYLAVLELGIDSVLNISKKAGVKRPTCYLVLDDLTHKGYVSKIEKKSTTLYAAEKPSIILNKYKEKIDNFKDLLPFYEAKFNRGTKPKIKFYEGKKQLWDVYTKILFPADEIYFFGTDIEKIYASFPDMVNDWIEKFIRKYKNSKEIISYNKKGIEYAKNEGTLRPIKIMPPDLPVFADSVITEDKLFIVSLDNLFGVLIESEDLAKTYKNFFLLAWRSALEIKDINQYA